MKKKIRKLTLKELDTICTDNRCETCPLSYYKHHCYLKERILIEERRMYNFDLNKEVEINE